MGQVIRYQFNEGAQTKRTRGAISRSRVIPRGEANITFVGRRSARFIGEVITTAAPGEQGWFEASPAPLAIESRTAASSDPEQEQDPLAFHDDPGWKRFRSRLLESLSAEPLEDGVAHPAEIVLAAVLRERPFYGSMWVQAILLEVLSTPGLAAALVQCIGRLGRDSVGQMGPMVAIVGLQQRDVEVREAAVSAIEHWGGDRLTDVLNRHDEPIPWLRDYIARVIKDLSATR